MNLQLSLIKLTTLEILSAPRLILPYLLNIYLLPNTVIFHIFMYYFTYKCSSRSLFIVPSFLKDHLIMAILNLCYLNFSFCIYSFWSIFSEIDAYISGDSNKDLRCISFMEILSISSSFFFRKLYIWIMASDLGSVTKCYGIANLWKALQIKVL